MGKDKQRNCCAQSIIESFSELEDPRVVGRILIIS